MEIDATDKAILNIIQTDFPVAEHPYAVIGTKVGITEDEAFERVRALIDRKAIRRIGGNFDSRSIGYSSTLVACKVPAERIDEFAAILDGEPGVTHNYLRAAHYNIWFTYIGQGDAEVDRFIESMKKRTGIDEIYSLPYKNLYKINVKFDF